ncbi:MAG: glycosidase [Caulobacter sp.]|nr:glycosidase [Caulobacter sp.]
MRYDTDRLIFTPDEVDLSRSPLRQGLPLGSTFVLGAFNPGLAVLPGGNLLMMVRVAEALREPMTGHVVRGIRWVEGRGYGIVEWPLAGADVSDPRGFELAGGPNRLMGLTSLSWLLPVELSPDGLEVLAVHYDRAIGPRAAWQDYGVEDARISRIGATWYMTTCSISAQRQSTALYTSGDGLDWDLRGMVLDHQNKDMLLFEGLIDGVFWALTRPLGSLYFAWPPDSPFHGGPSINLATSPDALHWKPVETGGIRPRKGSPASERVGGGAQPVLTPDGWLVLYHGVEAGGTVGTYRTFWALLDAGDPTRILRNEDQIAVLEPAPALTAPLKDRMYLDGVVFTTGLADGGDHWIALSGEADLACRVTHIPKSVFR